MEYKLNYRIVKRVPMTVKQQPGATGYQPTSYGTRPEADVEIECVHVEWTHKDGFPPDTIDKPLSTEMAKIVIEHFAKEAIKQDPKVKELMDSLLVTEGIIPTHPSRPDLAIYTIPIGERKVIYDQLNVKASLPTNIIMQMLEDKRASLARSLNVEP